MPVTKAEVGVCRIRRGKLVEVPDEWVGKVASQRTANKRRELAVLKRLKRRRLLRLKRRLAFEDEGLYMGHGRRKGPSYADSYGSQQH